MDNENVDLSTLPICPKCNKGHMQQRNGKYGAFLGCTNIQLVNIHNQSMERLQQVKVISLYLKKKRNINAHDVKKVILLNKRREAALTGFAVIDLNVRHNVLM